MGYFISYTITVNNTGNVTLYNIEVKDPKTGLGAAITSLIPGAEENFTTSYTIVLADLELGYFENTAEAGDWKR